MPFYPTKVRYQAEFLYKFCSKYIFLTICNIFSAELLRNWLYCMILHYCIAVFCSIVSSLCIWINFHESFIYNSGHTLLHILDLLTILFMGKLKASCIKITYCDSILELNFHYLLIFWKSTVLYQYQPLNYVSGGVPWFECMFLQRDFSSI